EQREAGRDVGVHVARGRRGGQGRRARKRRGSGERRHGRRCAEARRLRGARGRGRSVLCAVHGAEGVATALFAYRFAATAAICRSRHFWMILAVHFSPSTCSLQCDAPGAPDDGLEAGAASGFNAGFNALTGSFRSSVFGSEGLAAFWSSACCCQSLSSVWIWSTTFRLS